MRFGSLVVTERGPNSPCGRVRWHCRCDCGKVTITQSNNLISNEQQKCSCGWYSYGFLKHGYGREVRNPTFKTWLAMRTRCTKNVYYLSKGITVCSRWDSSFKDFLLDMGERPAGCTIDRIDGNKGYEPGNCRWATAKQQAQNRPGWVCTAAEIAEICGRFEHGENHAYPVVTQRRANP